jgi:hypothetical protein
MTHTQEWFGTQSNTKNHVWFLDDCKPIRHEACSVCWETRGSSSERGECPGKPTYAVGCQGIGFEILKRRKEK